MTTTTEGTGQGSAEGPLRGFDLDNIRKVFIYQSGVLLPCIYIIGSGGTEKYVLRATGDGQVKIDPSDVSDYLGNKLVPGTNITFSTSVGPNKTITINAAGGGSGWTDDGTIVRLTTVTDDVGIGTVTAEGKTTIITDSAAKTPLVLKNAASQSTYAFAIKDSGGTVRNAISLGSAAVTGTLNTSLGANAGIAVTTGVQSTYVGESAGNSVADGNYNAAFGNKALQTNVSGSINTAIGHECLRDYTDSYTTAVGAGAMKICISGEGNTAIGANAMHDFGAPSTNGGNNTAVGRSAMAMIGTGAARNVGIGNIAGRRLSTGSENIIIGNAAAVGGGAFGLTTGSRNVSIGPDTLSTATFTGSNNVVVGGSATLATAATADATSVGDGTTCHTDSVVLGKLAASTASNQFVTGSSLHPINDVYLGKGVTNTTPTEARINGTGASGTDIAGANLVVAGGKGTGTGIPGHVAVKYPLITTTGTTLQSLSSDLFVVNTTMFTATATGTVANTVTETTILGSGIGTKTIPAGFFRPGRTIRITVRGIYSNTGLPTLQIQCKLGSIVIGNTGVNATVAATNSFFEVSEIFTCRTVGATGTVFAQGFFDEHSSSFNRHAMSNTTTNTVDTTVSQVIDVTATWGTADPANTISATNAIIEVLN